MTVRVTWNGGSSFARMAPHLRIEMWGTRRV
jgi:hypothetical protein